MKAYYPLLLLTFALATPSHAGTVDLSNGVVLPSNNSALNENPAVLGHYKDQVAEAALFAPAAGGEWGSGTVSLVGRSGWFGYGLGLWKQHVEDNTVSAGFGIHFADEFQLGSSVHYSIDTGGTTLDVGTRFSVSKDITMALVAYSVEHGWPRRWSLGLVPQTSSRMSFELDFRADTGGAAGIEPNHAELLAGMSLKVLESITVRFGALIDVHPQIAFPADHIELGLNYWVSEHIAIFALYQDHRGPRYQFGIKLK